MECTVRPLREVLGECRRADGVLPPEWQSFWATTHEGERVQVIAPRCIRMKDMLTEQGELRITIRRIG